MKNIIVGTAGHIDHGKTALVRALTGIDTDRLEEEKRRGISIDLGFAHLDLAPGVRAGFVDVPGHERFVKNMLAGAAGIDLVLLVVAADESIKPQTREHFDICRLLGVQKGLIALTKADRVDREILDLARLEVEEFVKGSFLEGAPVVPVSAVTREGLEELRARLLELALAAPSKDTSRHFRLPIDRVFSMRGFGTVVTGTLISGSIGKEQEVEVHPGGRRLRVRGIQVHGQAADRASAGQRTALNVTGAEPSELARGMTLADPGVFQAVRGIDALIELLPGAKPLKNNAPVHFHAGTAEVEARVRLLDGAERLLPGGRAYGRIVLREPLLLLPGDRFIIRMFSPVVTIGGGVVADITGHRYRRGENTAARLSALLNKPIEEGVPLLVRESRYGLSLPDLVTRTGLMPAEIEQAARSERLVALRRPQLWLADREWFQAALDRITGLLREFHRQHPLLEGMPKRELRSRELPGAPPFLLDAMIERAPGLVSEGEIVRLAAHKVMLKEDEERASGAIEKAFRDAGLAAPAVNEVLAKSGVEPSRARTLLQILLRDGRLVKVSDDLVFHRSAIDGLRARLVPHKGARISVPQFKDLAGISRKYAIPLLEYLDRERVTRREGDERLVL
ncbi:MAG: selenocysteine-specific translation elongation factor [Rhodospirillales bacterium]